MKISKHRPGEVSASTDPGQTARDANLIFIGRIRSPWKQISDCPKNLVQARERGKSAWVKINPPWQQGLLGLERFSHIILLHWLHEAQRNFVVQSPSHAPTPTGVFSLRSPVRPNPISFAAVRILAIDERIGRIDIDAIDCLDNTPLLDIKPYFASTDSLPAAVITSLKDATPGAQV